MVNSKTIFISHSSKDRDKVVLLANFIKKVCHEQFKNQYEVYYAPVELSKSANISSTVNQLLEQIQKTQSFIVFYTPNSVHSRWVHFEIGAAKRGRSKSEDINIIPFVKDDADVSPLIGNTPITRVESSDCIKDLFYRIFNESNNKDFRLDWADAYKSEMEQLQYALKTKKVYIVGSKALVQNRDSDSLSNDTQTDQPDTNKDEDEMWNTDRAYRFVKDLTERLIKANVKLASFPNVPTVGSTVARSCIQHEYADNYEIAGLYAFDDKKVKIDLPEQIFKDTILRYRKAYLRHMDVIVIVGGNTNTQNEYEATSEIKTLQVFPIPCFGGTAYNIFKGLSKLTNWNEYAHPCMGCSMSERGNSNNSESSSPFQCPRINDIVERILRYIPIGGFE